MEEETQVKVRLISSFISSVKNSFFINELISFLKEQLTLYRCIMLFLAFICLGLLYTILHITNFPNLFTSNLSIFLFIPLISLGLLFLILVFLNDSLVKTIIPWICAFILLGNWIFCGIYFLNYTEDKNLNTDNGIVEDNNISDFLNKISNKTVEINSIGDSFGSLNTLFSGIALAAVAFTIILQMRELSENREELAGQKEELKSQNVTEIQARFENSFFNLLETQRVIARSIIMDDNEFNNYKSPHLYKDKNIFKFLVENEIKMNMDRCIIYASQLNDEETNFKNILITKSSERLKFLVEKFNDISFIKDGRFDSYFRLTYRILKFVDEFDFDKVSEVQLRNLRLITNNHTHKSRKLIKNKSKSIKLNYTGLLRSQIGIYEQVMIFYNALNPKYAKCKKLIEKYNMFNSLRTSMLANVQDTLLYKLSAFGKLTYSRKVGGKNIDFNIQILDIDKFYDFIMHMRTRPLKAEEIDNINILFKYWLRGIIKNENYKFEECEILGLGWKK